MEQEERYHQLISNDTRAAITRLIHRRKLEREIEAIYEQFDVQPGQQFILPTDFNHPLNNSERSEQDYQEL